ncbi:outer membrane protein assembly factor BamE [Luteimonas deserti]|uniref:Outer membrane protein assembly factor BamE n=1 Tax=Luteimonas deserti TaxID=2752306 RepID=A0A7Z0QT62_9GAMM|nr:outer membrane protein assembly factor BamE [Luteimonas deserti]NYZ63332.1 outer membrane protein assembly factor BamE [Luteimonas deserti]
MQKLLLVPVLALLTSGCAVLYKQPIYQGNLIEQSAAEQLQVGMGKPQVEALLGTPSIADPFHHQRWDYTASERVGRSGRTDVRNFTVFFENDQVVRWEGDYFPNRDQALAEEMRKFGNLPRERGNRRR